MKMRVYLTPVLIAFCMGMASCNELPKNPALTKEDSIRIFNDVIENPERFAQVDTGSRHTTQIEVFGSHIKSETAAVRISEFSKRRANPLLTITPPTYVEFPLDSIEKNIARILAEIPNGVDYKKAHMRLYFSMDPVNTKMNSIILVTALPDNYTTPTTYTDNFKLIFNVGSPCPPDCNTGRLNQNGSTGALMAKEAYKNNLEECLKYRAPTEPGGSNCN